MKKSLKVAVTVLMIIAMLFISTNSVFAEQLKADDMKGSFEGSSSEEIKNIGNTIIGVITNVAVVAAVITIIVIGIKYIVGSADQKAEYKKTLIPMVVGIALVVFATKIVTILFGIG